MKYSLSKRAYSKLILHSYRYPHAAVNGVLVGKLSEGGASGKQVLVSDALPLFHGDGNINQEAMAHVALSQMDAYCKTHQLSIVGYYHGHESATNTSLSGNSVVEKYADKIRDNFDHACVLIINPAKFGGKTDEDMAVNAFVKTDGKWTLLHSEGSILMQFEDPGSVGYVDTLLKFNTHLKVIDFGDHLDDILKNWLNPHLLKT
eukprot:Nk52_evm13s230 gene=Nk52_evmTU13s230